MSKMKIKTLIFLFSSLLVFNIQTVLSENSSPVLKSSADDSSMTTEEILDRIEDRYARVGFTADFFQKSTIHAMHLTDTACGTAFFKHPGMMRWEYEKPDKQSIITDGKRLWIYKPEDNQVMIGKAPFYFGSGKGASFLADIKIMRKNFSISLEKDDKNNFYLLKLLPKEKKFDLAVIYLSVSKKDFTVFQIVTYNSYDDKTLIILSNLQFKQKMEDSLFSFKMPEGADILKIDQ